MHSRHNIEKLTSWYYGIRIYSDLLYRSGKDLKNSWICNSSICMLLSYLSRCAFLWGKMMILTAFKNHDVNLHELWCYPPILEVIHGWCRLLVAAAASTSGNERDHPWMRLKSMDNIHPPMTNGVHQIQQPRNHPARALIPREPVDKSKQTRVGQLIRSVIRAPPLKIAIRATHRQQICESWKTSWNHEVKGKDIRLLNDYQLATI